MQKKSRIWKYSLIEKKFFTTTDNDIRQYNIRKKYKDGFYFISIYTFQLYKIFYWIILI